MDNRDGVARILEIFRGYFDPEAAGATPQQEMRFTQRRRAKQSTDEFIAEFDLVQRKAESKMETGAGFPEQFISTLSMDNAGLPRKEKSLVMASNHKSLESGEVAANMRRSLGSRGGGGRQDVLITEEAVRTSESD